MSLRERLVEGVPLLALRQILASAATVASAVVLMRHLGAAQFGLLSLVISLISLATLLTGNFEDALQRYIPELGLRGEEGRAARMAGLALGGRILISVAVASGLFLAASPLAAAYGHPAGFRALLLVGAFQLVALGIDAIATGIFIGLQQYRWPILTTWLGAMGGLLVVVSAAVLGWDVVAYFRAAVALQLGLALVAVAIAFHRLPRLDRGPGDLPAAVPLGADARRLWGYAWPLWGHKATTAGARHGARAILGLFVPVAIVGNYAAARSIIDNIAQVYWQLPVALVPGLIEKLGREGRAAVRAAIELVARWSWAAGVVAAVCCGLFAHEIIRALCGPSFALAPVLFAIMALQLVTRFPANIWYLPYYVHDETRALFWLNALRLAPLLAGLLLVASRFGAVGVAVLDAGAFILSLGLLSWDVPRRFGVPGPEVRGPWLRALLLVGLAWGAAALSHATPVRVVIVATLPFGVFLSGVLKASDLAALDATTVSSRWSGSLLRWASRSLHACERVSRRLTAGIYG